MKYLTGNGNKWYDNRKSGHPVSRMPTFLSTNPCNLKSHGLASRSARLRAVVWLSYLTVSFFPQKLRLNKPCRQADYARVRPLRFFLPEDRNPGKPRAGYLYNLLSQKYSQFLKIHVLAILFSIPAITASAGICTGHFPNSIAADCIKKVAA